MGIIEYFFDSYAVIEIIKANQNYAKYLEVEGVVTIFNLAEIYFFAINNLNNISANIIYDTYKKNMMDVEEETLKEAIIFRKENKKRGLSYADCIGYMYALKNNMTFLTGDKEFEGLKNVEFVK